MIQKGIHHFSGKNVLLLQGPVGPFFWRFSKDLQAAGAQVFKVNFNSGDWIFYPKNSMNYFGGMENFSGWLREKIKTLNIDTVFMFGDCRPIHRMAHSVASEAGVEIGVFEEGYIRPDYVTLERHGVNGNSLFSKNVETFSHYRPRPLKRLSVGSSYWRMVFFGFIYFTVGALGKPVFRKYKHHRSLSIIESLPWIRAAWRKLAYSIIERGLEEKLTADFSGRYFLVPLQVFNDYQVLEHFKGGGGVEGFIEEVLSSFATHAPEESILVFKHHPMDRGYRDYSKYIRTLAERSGVQGRVIYIHDQHLPLLLSHARGVVVINSTVGISALRHSAPTKVCGKALYDIPGLTYQGTLKDFWRDAEYSRPSKDLFMKFREHLVKTTQLNGSFYRPIRESCSFSGLIWGERSDCAQVFISTEMACK